MFNKVVEYCKQLQLEYLQPCLVEPDCELLYSLVNKFVLSWSRILAVTLGLNMYANDGLKLRERSAKSSPTESISYLKYRNDIFKVLLI